MKTEVMKIFFAVVLLFVSASVSLAQDQPQWKVGDKIEVKNMSSEWVRATIIKIEDWRDAGRGFAYRVEVEDPNAPNRYWAAAANTIRALPNQTVNKQADNKNVGGNPQPNADGGTFKVGDRVDVYYNEKQGKNRGTIIEAKEGKFKVHYTGCKDYWDEWVDRLSVHSPATISADATEIKFLFGKWALTTVGISSDAIAWGKSGGVQINDDGSYVWYQDKGKAPVKGKWITDARVPGADNGTQNFDGVLIKDADGQDWKVFKWAVKNDTRDHVEVQLMCSGISDIGSRVR